MNDGGPAFPIIKPHDRDIQWANGMTLRDYFAAAALTGTLAAKIDISTETAGEWFEAVATGAYAMADAMIAERDKAK